MEINEYIENILADAYKREIDQEENVFRTLSFLPTSLAVLLAALALLNNFMPPPAFQPFPLTMYALLAILSLSILISIIFSFKAVWLKRFKYVPEEKILSFANELKEHYLKDPSIYNDNLNKKLINNIRRNILRQYTLSIETNHKHNNSRRIARNLSF